jgi:hypothetical protein
MTTDNKRNSYRVVYPKTERPSFIVNGASAPVLDCSESGLRVEVPAGHRYPRMGDLVSGHVRMRDGREIAVEGEVVRLRDQEVGLRLARPGIPLAVIFAEQRFLLARYPS